MLKLSKLKKNSDYKNFDVRIFIKDYSELSFEENLQKYYALEDNELSMNNWIYRWDSWLNEYVKLVFDETKHVDFIKIVMKDLEFYNKIEKILHNQVKSTRFQNYMISNFDRWRDISFYDIERLVFSIRENYYA
ncbi:MAG: hypothetical protein AAF960_20075, partial [Bacteroidota bacterium]